MTDKELMEKLLKVGYANNLSNVKLCKKLGFARRTLYDYLNGDRIISPRMKFKINKFIESGS